MRRTFASPWAGRCRARSANTCACNLNSGSACRRSLRACSVENRSEAKRRKRPRQAGTLLDAVLAFHDHDSIVAGGRHEIAAAIAVDVGGRVGVTVVANAESMPEGRIDD